MRFMVMIRADKNTEAGVPPSPELLAEMARFNLELAKAGVFLAGEGLHPSSEGARVNFSGGKSTVFDGPFAETKELIAGFWLWNVASQDEAIEWARRCPNPFGTEFEIEIRQLVEFEEFGTDLPPEFREAEALRAEAAEKASSRAAAGCTG
jgi:hypothetical protein